MTSAIGPAGSTSLDHPTVRSAVDILSLVPFSLGFHPRDSLVVVSVRGTGAIGLVARTDLREVGSQVVELLVDRVLADDGVRAVVVRYGGDPEDGPDGGHGPAQVVATALRKAGVDVLDILAVSGSGYRSLECSRPGCCPPQGFDLSEVGSSELSVTRVLAGHAVAPDRGALLADLAPRADAAVARAGASATRWAAHRDAVHRAHGEAGLRDWQVASVQRWTGRLVRSVEPGGGLPGAGECGELLAALTDPVVRDAVLLTVCSHRPAAVDTAGGGPRAAPTDRGVAQVPGPRGSSLPAHWPAPRLLAVAADGPRLSQMLSVAPHRPAADAAARVLASACAHADDRWFAPAAAALAWISWNLGEGARAALLVERALRVDPRHRLAQLVDRSLQVGLPPAWVEQRRLVR